MTTPGGQLTPGDDTTPPVYGVPEGAYVGTAGQSNSIARLSDISEESAKAMMQGAAAPSFNRQRDAAWGVFNDIAYAITGVQVDENGNPIQHIEDWATRELHNLGTVIADYGDALELKVEPWAVPTIAPLSQTINRRADPTFQLSDFMSPLVRGRSDQESHNHTHITTSTAWGLAEGWNVGQRTYLAFITPAINRAYSELWFMVGELADVNVPAAHMDVAIYVADENRVLTSQIGVIRVSDSLGPGRQLVQVPFDTWVATQGSYIAVAVRQWTGNTRPLLGLHDTPRPLSNVIFPRKITAQWNSTSSLPGTINGTNDLNFEADWFTPYIELSEAVGIDYRVFTEGWPDEGSERGRPWVPLTSQGIGSGGGYTAAVGVGTRVSMYDTPLSTDSVRVRSSIHTTYSTNMRRSTLIVRGTNNLRSGVGLSALNRTSSGTGGRYELILWTDRDPGSSWDDRTVVAVINRVPVEGDQIEVDYLDGLVTVRINGHEYFADAPAGGPQGAAGRFVGIQNERTSSGGLFPTYYSSPWFGPWSARDLPRDDGGGDDDEGYEGPIVGE